MFAAGEATLAGIGLKLWPSNQADYRRWRGVASAALEPGAFEAAWMAGAALSVDEALALAPRSSEADAGSSGTRQLVGGTVGADAGPAVAALTARELEVARLVAAGLTNRQVGQALVITEKTAANHVQRVLDKLALHSRAQLAARATALGVQSTESTRA